jgi:hypothetical protein
VEDFDCRASAEDIRIGGEPVVEDLSYGIAVNDFIARGGSGFTVLARNTTKVDTDISLRDGVQNFFGAFFRLRDFVDCGTVNTSDPAVCDGASEDSLAGRCCDLTACYGTAANGTTEVLERCTSEVGTQNAVLCSAFDEDDAERQACEDKALADAAIQCAALPCIAGPAAIEDARIKRILP